jgi:hypothetical protein
MTLHTRLRPWKHILSIQGLGGYTRLVRSRAPPEKKQYKTSRGPSDDLAKSPVKSKPDGQPLEEYPYSSTVSGLLSGTTIRGTQIKIENHSPPKRKKKKQTKH